MSSTRRRRKGCATQSSHALEDRRSVAGLLGKDDDDDDEDDDDDDDGSFGRDGRIGGELGEIPAAGGRNDATPPPLGDSSGDGIAKAASAGDTGGDKELVDSDDDRPDMLVRVEDVSALELSQSCNAHAPHRKKYCGSVTVRFSCCLNGSRA